MSSSLGRVTARLAEPTKPLAPNLIALINQNVRPPTEVTADEVFVRAMYIVSDQVNSFGGRFPVEEHARLVELLIDSPVLTGHRKDKLPVGRNFHAETVEREGRPWVKCYFYWLRSSEDAEQLRDNIDGGIYKECSIAFTFGLPRCSICGQDVRQCEHEPFEEYDINGVQEVCHFDYCRIEKVLETSLVYRGAVPETSISKDLNTQSEPVRGRHDYHDQPSPVAIDSPESLEADGEYLIVPRYDGLPLTAQVSDDTLSLTRLDGRALTIDLGDTRRPTGFRTPEPTYGVLIGYRGRERCSRKQLERYLLDRRGPVNRLALNVYPLQGLVTLPRAEIGSRWQVRMVPHRMASRDGVEARAREIMTRDGVEIWPLSPTGMFKTPSNLRVFSYQPRNNSPLDKAGYRLEVQSGSDLATLTLSGVGLGSRTRQTFELVGFDSALWRRGRRFVARPLELSRCPTRVKSTVLLDENISTIERRNDCLVMKGAGRPEQKSVLRPIRLGGHDLFLFSIVKCIADGRRVAEVAGA